MNINQQQLKDALSERYLAYALSTITARSLPDLRDGLKPVHRRLIHAMAELKLNPETGFKKCARIVGDVMGKYHPHGDSSIYDAMVRMAQEFSLRYPLVDGQGNFGNIDGDNAAAMRYTEARMTKFSEWMLQDINRNTVDFRPTYDGEGQEPELLPAAFPNLLANGAQGIAVGMATNIPPHNIHELCDALLMLLDNPQQSVISLLRVIKGPDFPTGGVMVENTEETINAYRTGKGSFRLRARWQVEVHKGGAYQIAITEIPFQVQKSKLIEKIAELVQNRKLPLIGDIRDESAEDIRIVIHPKNRAVEANHIMSLLFKQTDLETKFSMNMNVLDKGQIPKVMPLTEVLNKWLEHRREVMLRANQYRLQEIAARLEILAAYLIAYRNLDLVIKLIREQDDAKQALMAHLKIPENYADTILAMRLRQLHKLEEGSITKENQKLRQEQKDIGALLASDALQDEALKQQITELKNKCDAPRDKRLTSIEKITLAEEVIPEDLLTEKEPLTIIYSDKDWIKMAKTHLAADHPHRFKDGDGLRFVIHCHSTDQLQILTSYGKSYSLPASKITSARGFGEPLRLLLDIEANERIIACNTHNDQQKWLLANNYGLGFVVSGDKLKAQTRSGRQVMVLKEGGAKACQVTHCLPLKLEQNRVAVLSDDRKLLLFDIAEIPELARGQGVILQKYKGSYMADIQLFNAEQGPTYQKAGQAKNIADYQAWLGKRGQVGKLPPVGFPHKASF